MSDIDKPECYGDPDQYDPDDEGCDECAYSAGCSIRSRRNRAPVSVNRTSSRSSPVRMQHKHSTTKNQVVSTTEAEDEDTYLSVLSHNAGIEAIQAIFDELANSVRHVPRKTYTNIWRRKKQ